jgi:hypothetical protein
MMVGIEKPTGCDPASGELKDLMDKIVGDFVKHPGSRTPECAHATNLPNLHFPEWMAKFEACVRDYKK